VGSRAKLQSHIFFAFLAQKSHQVLTADAFGIFTSAKEVIFLPVFVCLFVCLSVCEQDNSKSYGRIFLKFWGYVGHGISYKWLNFGGDPAGVLDSGSLRNFRYHCVKGGIKEPLQNRRWWRHLANSIALAEVPASYDCFLRNVDFFMQFFMQCFLLPAHGVGASVEPPLLRAYISVFIEIHMLLCLHVCSRHFAQCIVLAISLLFVTLLWSLNKWLCVFYLGIVAAHVVDNLP